MNTYIFISIYHYMNDCGRMRGLIKKHVCNQLSWK